MAAVEDAHVLRHVAPLTLGHGAVDLAQGAVPAAIPVFVERFHLGYVQAGLLAVAVTISSSLVQPLFGLAADGGGRGWLLTAGVAASAGGLAASGLLPAYPLVLAALLVSGLGIAAYHPEGARAARALAGSRPAAAMSLFSVGGNLGAALGPLCASLGIALAGAHGTAIAALPALAALPVVHHGTRRLAAHGRIATRRPAGDDRPRALAMLLGGVILRGYVYYGVITFAGLYEHEVRGRSTAVSAAIVGLFLAGGVGGTLGLGRIADRLGHQRALAGSFALVGPLLTAYVLVSGPLGLVALVLAGACLIGTFSVSIVLGQGYLPSRVATASGLLLGVGIGAGALAGPLVGLLADAHGLRAALGSACAVAFVGSIVLAFLPAGTAPRA